MFTKLSASITTDLFFPARKWMVVVLLCVVGCLNYLDRIMITTMRSSLLEVMPMTDAQFGLLTSVFLWVYGLLSPFAGFMADRFNRSRVIVISLLVWSAVTWLTAYVTTFEQLLVTRALMGVSEACYIPAALALIADYHRGPTRSTATGVHMAGIMVGQSLGFMGGWIAESYDWNDPFLAFGIIGVAYALILALVLRDAPNRKEKSFTNSKSENKVGFANAIQSLFTRRSFMLAVAFWGLIGIVGWMIGGWLPTFYKEHFQLSQTVSGFYATVYLYGAALIGVLFGGIWADRWARKNPRGRIFVPAIGLCLAAPGIFLASNTALLSVAIIGFIIYAFTRAFSDANMMPILCMVTDPRYRATGYGVLNMLSCIVGGVGIYVTGLLRDKNIDLTVMFQFAAASVLICAAILFTIRANVKPGDET